MLPLRSDYLVALNEAVAALEAAANLYETAAAVLSEKHPTAALARLVARRRAMARVLKRMVQAHDDVPSPPTSEQLILQGAVTRLKSLWAEDETASFVEDILTGEAAAEEHLTQAAALAEDEASAQRLKGFATEIRSAASGLRAEGI